MARDWSALLPGASARILMLSLPTCAPFVAILLSFRVSRWLPERLRRTCRLSDLSIAGWLPRGLSRAMRSRRSRRPSCRVTCRASLRPSRSRRCSRRLIPQHPRDCAMRRCSSCSMPLGARISRACGAQCGIHLMVRAHAAPVGQGEQGAYRPSVSSCARCDASLY